MRAQALIKVWDLPTRIFHWLLVAGFFVAYFTEEDLLAVHVWAGYLVFGLLWFRLLWGFIGNSYARFTDFIVSPMTSIRYIKDLFASKAKRYIGHNPAGAAMIALLLSSVLITILAGFALYGADQHAGPFIFMKLTDEKFWKQLHVVCATVSVGLVVVHIMGVIVESIVHHENLLKAMFSGYKKANDE